MYRTGDLGPVASPMGEIEFHGRADRQVKGPRLFRVELSESRKVLWLVSINWLMVAVVGQEGSNWRAASLDTWVALPRKFE